MPIVHIPAAMRALTGGASKVEVPGGTLGEVIDALEERHPGLKARMVQDGKLRGGLAAFVNDQSPNAGLQTKVGPNDEVYFAPAIAGGSGESPSPFPGMDPYIEGQIWKDFHGAFLYGMRAELVRQVRPEYEVLAQEDVYVEYDDSRQRRTIEPDLLVAGTAPRADRGRTDVATAPVSFPIPLPALALDEERHTYLEIRRLPGRRLVTVVELLSPTNKQPGDRGRDRYLEKRRDLQASDVHLVEIDLLRGGVRLPMGAALPPAAYYLIISRGDRRPIADVMPLPLRARLPELVVPLLAEDAAAVDLQEVFDGVYRGAGYDYILDYSAPAVPPLEQDDPRWAEALIAQWRSTRHG